MVKINRDFVNRMKNDPEFAKLSEQEKMIYYHRNEQDIVSRYPVIVRYLLSVGLFSAKAMRMYIDKNNRAAYRSEDEYCERGADYIKYVYMDKHAHFNTKQAQAVWVDAKNALADELKEFKQNLDDLKKEQDDLKQITAYERRQGLADALNRMRDKNDEAPSAPAAND